MWARVWPACNTNNQKQRPTTGPGSPTIEVHKAQMNEPTPNRRPHPFLGFADLDGPKLYVFISFGTSPSTSGSLVVSTKDCRAPQSHRIPIQPLSQARKARATCRCPFIACMAFATASCSALPAWELPPKPFGCTAFPFSPPIFPNTPALPMTFVNPKSGCLDLGCTFLSLTAFHCAYLLCLVSGSHRCLSSTAFEEPYAPHLVQNVTLYPLSVLARCPSWLLCITSCSLHLPGHAVTRRLCPAHPVLVSLLNEAPHKAHVHFLSW